MNLVKLQEGPGPDPEYEFLKAIAKRMEKTVGPWLGFEEAIAFMAILQLYRIQFRDGFVINDLSQVDMVMGGTRTGALAACFCKDPDKDWAWWKTEFPAHDQESETYLDVYYRLLGRIAASPNVSQVGGF